MSAPRVRADMLFWLVGLLVIAAADHLGDVSWAFYLGGATAFVGWEVTKWRLRRLRDQYEPTR